MTKTAKIIARIESQAPGWVFTPSDLVDLATPHLVGMVLLRLVRQGVIRRLQRGLYDIPRHHASLGMLSPDAASIAAAIARRDGTALHDSEAAAANALRLTEQVPAQVEFLTDGSTREVVVGNQRIRLKKRAGRKLKGIAESSSLVFSSLRNLGARAVTEEVVAPLQHLLTPEQRSQLLRDAHRAPRWMRRFLSIIAGDPPDHHNTK
ncbi:MAG: DUF6088 family protein [Planctomycetes bacterium]|nr:DUF6088 family protein [Planctomycetota bacterium]MCC7398562.1 hypothetical protein [Planctomycetota bacterium]